MSAAESITSASGTDVDCERQSDRALEIKPKEKKKEREGSQIITEAHFAPASASVPRRHHPDGRT